MHCARPPHSVGINVSAPQHRAGEGGGTCWWDPCIGPRSPKVDAPNQERGVSTGTMKILHVSRVKITQPLSRPATFGPKNCLNVWECISGEKRSRNFGDDVCVNWRMKTKGANCRGSGDFGLISSRMHQVTNQTCLASLRTKSTLRRCSVSSLPQCVRRG